MYEGCVSHLVVVQYLVMPHVRHVYVLQPLVRPHVRHVCVLLPLVRPHVRHARLVLYIAASLKGRATSHLVPLVVVLLVLLQWDVLGSDYYLVQTLLYNY